MNEGKKGGVCQSSVRTEEGQILSHGSNSEEPEGKEATGRFPRQDEGGGPVWKPVILQKEVNREKKVASLPK